MLTENLKSRSLLEKFMSRIAPVDLGSQYGYTAAVIDDVLEGEISGRQKGKIVPKNVLAHAQKLFELALNASLPESAANPSEAICAYRLVSDVISRINGKEYHLSSELEIEIQSLADLTCRLEQVEQRPVGNSLGVLQKFFQQLKRISDEAVYGCSTGYMYEL